MNKFDYVQVDTAILEYRSLSNRMDAELAAWNEDLKVLQGESVWAGEDNDYFEESYYKLMSVSDDLSIAMKNIALYVQKISDNYKKLEEGISLRMEGWNGIWKCWCSKSSFVFKST